MKISKLILLVVAVLATSNCLRMHTTRYILSNPNYNTPYVKVFVEIEEDSIKFFGCSINDGKFTKNSAGAYTILS